MTDHPRTDPEGLVERVARAFMLETVCGLSVGGERVFCDDPRAPDHARHTHCECKAGARAALSVIDQEALLKAERERCAKVAEEFQGRGPNANRLVNDFVGQIAERIRSLPPVTDEGRA